MKYVTSQPFLLFKSKPISLGPEEFKFETEKCFFGIYKLYAMNRTTQRKHVDGNIWQVFNVYRPPRFVSIALCDSELYKDTSLPGL